MKRWIIAWISRNCIKPHLVEVHRMAVTDRNTLEGRIISEEQLRCAADTSIMEYADRLQSRMGALEKAHDFHFDKTSHEIAAQRGMIEALVLEIEKLKAEISHRADSIQSEITSQRARIELLTIRIATIEKHLSSPVVPALPVEGRPRQVRSMSEFNRIMNQDLQDAEEGKAH